MTAGWGLFALVHWVDVRGPVRSVAGPTVNTIPFALFSAVGLLRLRADRPPPAERAAPGGGEPAAEGGRPYLSVMPLPGGDHSAVVGEMGPIFSGTREECLAWLKGNATGLGVEWRDLMEEPPPESPRGMNPAHPAGRTDRK
jgi:hypothetical protein